MDTPSMIEKGMSVTDHSNKTMGLMLLESGKISAQDAERILRLQKEKKLRFGEAALQLGLISETDVQQILAKQFDYPYLSAGEGGFSRVLDAAYHPFSAQVENIRALRSQLMLRWFSDARRGLAVVGVSAEDKISYLASNLAVVFSQLGERTLLVDANLRAPDIHQLFNLGNAMGLSDVLAERADLSAIVKIPHFLDLSVLPAGTQPPNPAELLSKGRLSELLTDFAGQYDVILLTTPPVELAADFQAVAARTGGALISMRKDKTKLADISNVKQTLGATGVEVVGAVLNNN